MDYFDVLPVHPRPEPLESLSSYLIRLAEANDVGSAQGFVRLLFPNADPASERPLRGYPLASFAQIATLAGCSEESVRATTFFYLGERFGWPGEANLHLFLHKCLAPRLRYCPQCLVERPYYSLAWRFRWLEGCPVHGGRLLDHCGHCHRAARIFGPPLRIGLCPACGGRYRHCSTEALDGAGRARARSRFQDLEYILTPGVPKPRDILSTQWIGYQFAIQRNARDLSLEAVANLTHIPVTRLAFMERGDLQRGLRLQDYLAYADGLELPLRDLLVTPVSFADIEGLRQDRINVNDETAMAESAQAGSMNLGQPPLQHERTPRQNAEALLQRNASYTRVLTTGRTPKLTAEALLREALQMVDALGRLDEPISLAQVARRMKVSVCDLTANWIGASLVRHIEAAKHRQRTLRALRKRDELAERVAQAVAELKARQQPITRRAILAATGLPVWKLDLYPSLKKFYWAHLPE